jgi:PIN domain nuclease of toxin-antitoxin system
VHLSRLPPLHRDPFDRMLVCQALIGALTIVTPDADIARYPVRTLLPPTSKRPGDRPICGSI